MVTERRIFTKSNSIVYGEMLNEDFQYTAQTFEQLIFTFKDYLITLIIKR